MGDPSALAANLVRAGYPPLASSLPCLDSRAELSDAARALAWSVYLQLATRITTIRMDFADGDDRAALASVASLFAQLRATADERGAASEPVAGVAFHMLNHVLRPLTGKWHHRAESGLLANHDHRRQFRAELRALQHQLSVYQDWFEEIASPGVQSRRRRATNFSGDGAPLASPLPSLRASIEIDPVIEAAEFRRINRRRARRKAAAEPGEALADDATAPLDTCGLCLSGGGIRSATFALGVLDRVAASGVLRHVDYLSTVSGGGYLGGYISSRLHDQQARHPPPDLSDAALFADRPDGDQRASVDEQSARRLRNKSRDLAANRLGALRGWAKGLAINIALLAAIGTLVASALWLNHRVLGAVSAALPVLVVLVLFAGALWRWRRSPRDHGAALTPVRWSLAAASVMLLQTLLWQWLHPGGAGAFDDDAAAIARRWWLLGLGAVTLSAALTYAAGRLARHWSGKLLFAAAPLAWIAVLTAALLALQATLASWQTPVWLPALIAGLLLGRLADVDINAITPASHYRDHLFHTYLAGSSHNSRAAEDQQLADIDAPDAPYHLINTTLNLPSSDNPALRGRASDVFCLSALHCGSTICGHALNEESGWGQLPFATAIATSGAAASPMMGYKTRPSFASWLAVFNVRLALWQYNSIYREPGSDTARHRRLAQAPKPPTWLLLRELYPEGDDRDRFLNLSDGGHSENLGIYELLRRRCQTIICIDAEADPQLRFDGMIRLIRLAKIDFGIDLKIDLEHIRRGPHADFSFSHFALGTIDYPAAGKTAGCAPDETRTGYLLYIKSSLTGNEPEPILDFQHDYPSFPHQTTMDQFFSEAQFEAYRSLGEHIGDDLFQDFFDLGWLSDLCDDLGLDRKALKCALGEDAQADIGTDVLPAAGRCRAVNQQIFSADHGVQWLFARLIQQLAPDQLPRLKSQLGQRWCEPV